MVGTVHQRRLQADNRVSGQHTVFDAVLQALFNRREEGFWNRAAEYLLLKDEVVADGRLKLNPNVAELAVTAGLFLVFALVP